MDITSEVVADHLGRQKIADAIGVGLTAVSNAVSRKKFPPSWFLVISEMAVQAGVECPPELFGMKSGNVIVPQMVDHVNNRFPNTLTGTSE